MEHSLRKKLRNCHLAPLLWHVAVTVDRAPAGHRGSPENGLTFHGHTLLTHCLVFPELILPATQRPQQVLDIMRPQLTVKRRCDETLYKTRLNDMGTGSEKGCQ